MVASCNWTDSDCLAQPLDHLAGHVDPTGLIDHYVDLVGNYVVHHVGLVGRPGFLVGLIEVVVPVAQYLVRVDQMLTNHVVGSASHFADLVALVEQVEHTFSSRGLGFDALADLVGLAEHFVVVVEHTVSTCVVHFASYVVVPVGLL